MAPSVSLATLSRRVYCSDGYYHSGGCSGWYWYGRWVLAAVLIGLFILALLAFVCLRARRRKKGGPRPQYATGWTGPNYGPGAGAAPYAPPPQYSPGPGQNQPYGQTQYGQNQYQYPTYGSPNDGGYYSGQQEGVQPPQNAYYPRGNDNVYEPPAGPPPGK
ncbi:hypothetical protein VTK73DRAFT_3255 [Phialemonium thermophilum]|uniref:Chitin synthesis regulation, Congo red resistance, RCR protein n=1 Tax=Phialemonium thermophilum TaxID=223376 RepID=A0ABR3Y7J4_9PEZI